jgi:transposase-like protein
LPEGPVCPHCAERERVSKMQGKATRFGLYKCYACRRQFRVTVNTIFEKSHVPLHLWLQAFYLICGSKKGISSNQLHRTLGVTLKTAWFMGHRIREAMRIGSLSTPDMGSGGSIVEADETYFTKKKGAEVKRGFAQHKFAILGLVDRAGQARTFVIEDNKASNIVLIIEENLSREARLATDEAPQYIKVGKLFAKHRAVAHQRKQWVRGEFHTNTAEGYFGCSSGDLPALRRAPPSPLRCGVRLPLQSPGQAGRGRQAVDLSNDWFASRASVN